MFGKSFLLNKVVNTLNQNEFEVFTTKGCFDIAARREHLFLIKTLLNVDGLNPEHATSLRAISYFLSAYPFVISTRNNRDLLEDETVYTRFDLPVLTPNSFEEMITEDEITVSHSAKGRHTKEINIFALKERRKELEYTLEQLANEIGISKKALYEIENKRVNPTGETVKKLESILAVKLSMPYEMRHAEPAYLKPKDEFQKNVSREFSRIGIDNTSVYSAPFEIIGKEKFSLITALSEDAENIRRESTLVKGLSRTLNSKAVFVAKKTREKNVEGVRIVLESELVEIESPKDLSDILEEE